ncbi:MAG: DoxX family protein [Proteobacteria bacterium]|nr:DoxX family protein [Pseudomonadota bacterium]
MKRLFQRAATLYTHAAVMLAHLGPLTLLLMRAWVAIAFWQAGVVKLADPTGTQFLFNHEYHVPLLSGNAAAFLGTWTELITPWLLAVGIAARPTALILFVYNIVAVVAYPDLWPHGFWTGLFNMEDFADHKVWGLMLLAVVAWGPGALSVDALAGRWLRPRSQALA